MINTEKRNESTMHIDKMSTSEMLGVMQNENYNAVKAIDGELPRIAEAIDSIAERMSCGGRLFYVGCGTSGRLGVLDASECPPTFGVDPELVVGIIAGGDGALRTAVEGAEDDRTAGRSDIVARGICQRDSLIGISVSGGAAYVLGALEAAREAGALTVALTSNEGSAADTYADIGIHPSTGAEPITGSTRMKAGSAHKMILNMISTSVMVKLGHVYENLMINLRPTNKKLRARMISIVSTLAEVDRDEAERLLAENSFVIRAALQAAEKGEAANE
ncbi:MAG: N-acetylmuramic acid 6-phosphate etherase [Clostridia bacterium]|nr:N-acetylmuramic acid 6-phosphate etherase [Clostridia bacterium]